VCVPEQRATCKQRARDMEVAFSKTLATTFRASPECATVQFLVSNEESSLPEGLAARFANVMGSGYWGLRVDFRPGLTSQPFTLGLAKSVPRIAGDDVEHSAAYICKAANPMVSRQFGS
jgi:hypothetical protein